MKKGASHVDWAISMGIFLVYVMLMLIFLQPTSQPVYSGSTLLDTVHRGINNDTTYTVQRGYLIITPTDLDGIPPDSEGRYNIRIKNVKAYLSDEWKESEDLGLKHLTMFNKSLGKVPSQDLNDQDVKFDFECEGDSCGLDEIVLDIIAELENNENNVFWFVYSEEEIYSHYPADIRYSDSNCQLPGTEPGTREYNCLLNDGDDPLSRTDDFIYEFGMIETYSGFSQKKLNDLKANPRFDPESAEGYDNLKKEWNFPEDKNFKINCTDLTSPETIVKFEYYKDLEPEQGVNVYVSEEKVWFLDEKGYLVPANLVTTVW